MSNLLEQIEEDRLQARKDQRRFKSGVLTTLVAEAAMVGKNATPPRQSTDEEVVSVIKKFIKNIDQTLSFLGDPEKRNDVEYESLIQEKKVLEEYLPSQLSEAGLREIAFTFTNKGEFMQFLKINHPGQYDGRLASDVFSQR